MEFLDWIQNNGFSTWVREDPTIFAYPTFLAVHTFGLIFLVGPNVAIDLRILGFAPTLPLAPMKKLFPLMWLGFLVNLLSGLVLWSLAPVMFLTTPVFYVKLAAVWLGVVNLRLLRHLVFNNPENLGTRPVQGRGRVLAATSLAFWAVAIYSGRVSAYFPFVQRQAALALLVLVSVVMLVVRFAPTAWSSSTQTEPLQQSK
jgi:hypothetical protein